MSLFYNKKKLMLSSAGKEVDLKEVTANLKTPFYLYDLKGIQQRAQKFADEMGQVAQKTSLHYAMKANDHPKILNVFHKLGYGLDLVSGGELSLARAEGFSAEKIVFSGVGKTVEELEQAIGYGIKQINVESPQELLRIANISKTLGKKANVALRMNPDVSVETHPYITTGFRNNKFGMDESFLPEVCEIFRTYGKELNFLGLTMHVGSQLTNIDSIVEAARKTLDIFKGLKAQGFALQSIDVGGGLGIDYKSMDWSKDLSLLQKAKNELQAVFKDFSGEVLFEPGRFLVGRFGLLVTEIQYIKKTPYKNFAIVDTGMHHLIRPCLYQGYHSVLTLEKREEHELYDVVGPICESSDVLASQRHLPKLLQGDRLVIADVGAYGEVMSSDYNRHPKCKIHFI